MSESGIDLGESGSEGWFYEGDQTTSAMADLRPTIIWLNALLIALTLCAVVSRVCRRIFVVGKFHWYVMSGDRAIVLRCQAGWNVQYQRLNSSEIRS